MMDTALIYLTLLLNATTAVVCAALGMLVVWQDTRRSSNQLVGLALFCFAAYSLANLFVRFNYIFNLPPGLMLYATITFYGLSVLTLFVSAARFVQMARRRLALFTAIGLGMALGLSRLTLSDSLFIHISPSANHIIIFDFTPSGLIALLLMLFYQIGGIVLIRAVHNERSQAVWPILVLMPLQGVLTAYPVLGAVPHDALVLLTIALLFARLVMREHVFKPLHRLNDDLIHANQELEQANQFKSQFLANMSHELRTPLNAIIGYTDLITGGAYGTLTDRQDACFRQIGKHGRYLLALISDVLDLSKIEAGRMELAREPLSLTDTIDTVLPPLRVEAAAKGLLIRVDLPGDLPLIQADPLRIEQILRNLLSNAIKYTDAGAVTVTAQAEAGEVTLAVTDTGIGISPAQQPYIFDLYRLIDRRHSEQYAAGTHGLALAITRYLVQLHGGRIRVTSQGIPGKGTTFYVTLPVTDSRSSADTPDAAVKTNPDLQKPGSAAPALALPMGASDPTAR